MIMNFGFSHECRHEIKIKQKLEKPNPKKLAKESLENGIFPYDYPIDVRSAAIEMIGQDIRNGCAWKYSYKVLILALRSARYVYCWTCNTAIGVINDVINKWLTSDMAALYAKIIGSEIARRSDAIAYRRKMMAVRRLKKVA